MIWGPTLATTAGAGACPRVEGTTFYRMSPFAPDDFDEERLRCTARYANALLLPLYGLGAESVVGTSRASVVVALEPPDPKRDIAVPPRLVVCVVVCICAGAVTAWGNLFCWPVLPRTPRAPRCFKSSLRAESDGDARINWASKDRKSANACSRVLSRRDTVIQNFRL